MFQLSAKRVWIDGAFRPATLRVQGGRVVHVGPLQVGADRLDDDLVVLPALTDTHVHLNEPGRTAWEGFASGTAAAAVGGVTLLVDMPLNSDPPTTTVVDVERKVASATGQIHVDVGLWGGVIPGNSHEMPAMVQAGVLGFKAFLCPSGIDEFPPCGETDLRIAMNRLRGLGVPLLAHAELESELAGNVSDRTYAAYLHSRPPEWEVRAVALICALVAETGCRAHIVHLSAAGALDVVAAAKAAGLPVTAETCPHYLGLAAEDIPDGATEYKCAPPVRERENQDLLWAALRNGTLDFVVTDHSPCLPALKRLENGLFADAWGGIASLQLGLRSVWTEAQKRGVGLADVLRWMATGPADFIGAADRGRIVAGATADLVAFAPDRLHRLDPATLLHKHPTTPWAGRLLRGELVTTWLRGEVVAESGRLVGPPTGELFRLR